MNLQDVKELMETMARTGVSVLDWDNCGSKIHLERKAEMIAESAENIMPIDYLKESQNNKASEIIKSPTSKDTAGKTLPDSSGDNQQEAEDEEMAGEIIKSPVVGVYYSAPSPDSDPFIQVGSKVESGNTLCIIEAMKLMNEVTSSVDGEVADIYVENGQRVEFGQPLFRII